MRSGRDIVIAAMLGAEEYGFGTAAMVATGCVMARQCHLNTCPVGVATQDPALRAKYPGTPEMVVNFMLGVANEVRTILASLGHKSLNNVIGRPELLQLADLVDYFQKLQPLTYQRSSHPQTPQVKVHGIICTNATIVWTHH